MGLHDATGDECLATSLHLIVAAAAPQDQHRRGDEVRRVREDGRDPTFVSHQTLLGFDMTDPVVDGVQESVEPDRAAGSADDNEDIELSLWVQS